MRHLRAEVERVVAPVQASPWRRDRMREELLAHLSSLYESERSRRPDPAEALNAARGRFGDAAELTRELQQSVPVVERILWYQFPGHGWQRRRPGESATSHIVRTARRATVAIAVSNLALIAVCGLIAQFAGRRPVPEKPPLVNVAAFLAVCSIVQIIAIVVLPLCSELVHRQFALYRAARGQKRTWHAVLVVVGLLLATSTGTASAAAIIGLFNPLLRIPVVNERQFLLGLAVAALLTLVLSLIQSWQQARAARQFDDLYGVEMAD